MEISMEQGTCPNCQKNNLEYGDSVVEGDQIYYEWECMTCGATGKEWYSLEFIEHVWCKECLK